MANSFQIIRIIVFTEFALDAGLLKAVEKLGLTTPTPIQQAMIPRAMEGRDIQASAETGSGKTAAYMLPLCHRLLQDAKPDTATRCLILLPTRELAEQAYRQFKEVACFTHLKAGLIVGGSNFKEQKALIRKNPEFLIGTPGRLLEHVQKKSVELQDLEALVLDEADRMLDMGFRDDVLLIVKACRQQRQTILLSATLNHTGIGRIAGQVLQAPEIIAIGSHREEHGSITQQIILADDNGHKLQLLTWLLANETYAKALVFTNTREGANELAEKLARQRGRVALLHGELVQDERKWVMEQFRQGRIQVLVATDLAARGLDIEGVDLVVNFALARSGDEYVHRIGRTGRAGRQGLALSLISPQEWNRMCSIQRKLRLGFERRLVPEFPARFRGEVAKKSGRKPERKKSPADKKADAAKPKAKQRHRNRKNIGKRRKPSEKPGNIPGNIPGPDNSPGPDKSAEPTRIPKDKRKSSPAGSKKKKETPEIDGFAPFTRKP